MKGARTQARLQSYPHSTSCGGSLELFRMGVVDQHQGHHGLRVIAREQLHMLIHQHPVMLRLQAKASGSRSSTTSYSNFVSRPSRGKAAFAAIKRWKRNSTCISTTVPGRRIAILPSIRSRDGGGQNEDGNHACASPMQRGRVITPWQPERVTRRLQICLFPRIDAV